MSFDTPDIEKNYSTTQRITLTLAACAGMTFLATPLLGYLDLANIVMLFLLTVLVVAVKLGRNAAILASVISVLCFDVFFVPPRFSLAVSNIQYLVTFFVMLVTALTTTHFTSVLRQRAQEAIRREQRTQALYQLAKQLAGALTIVQLIEIADSFVRTQLPAHACVLTPDETRTTLGAADARFALPIEPLLAHIAFESGKFVRSDEVHGLGYASLYFPLKASMRLSRPTASRSRRRASTRAWAPMRAPRRSTSSSCARARRAPKDRPSGPRSSLASVVISSA